VDETVGDLGSREYGSPEGVGGGGRRGGGPREFVVSMLLFPRTVSEGDVLLFPRFLRVDGCWSLSKVDLVPSTGSEPIQRPTDASPSTTFDWPVIMALERSSLYPSVDGV